MTKHSINVICHGKKYEEITTPCKIQDYTLNQSVSSWKKNKETLALPGHRIFVYV